MTMLRLVTSKVERRQWKRLTDLLRTQRVIVTAPVRYQSQSDFIFRSPDPDIHIPRDVKWFDHVKTLLPKHGDKPAFIFPAPYDVTQRFSDLEPLVTRLASGLLRNGYQPGECTCIVMGNCPEYTLCVFAITNIGGIVTTCNPAFTVDEMVTQLKDSKSRYIITQEEHLDKVKEAAKKAGNIQEIIVREPGEALGPGLSRYSPLQNDDGSAYKHIKVDTENDVALLPYSSGTTGLPKGVMLTHSNLVSNALQMAAVMEQENDAVWLSFLPSFHVSGLVMTSTVGLITGMTFVVMKNFVAELFLKYLQDYKCTGVGLVPPICNFLARSDLVDGYDLSELKELLCGAAPLSAELQNIVIDRLGVDIRQIYGMTELSPVLSQVKKGINLPGSSGTLVPNTYAKIVDVDTGETHAHGGVGEIVVKGPQVMKGYLNKDEATKHTIRDGWLHTGDVGYFDENEQLFVSDRVKELIKYKAYQVPPAELEGVIMSHDDIADCGVIGVPDDRANELPRAYVVLKEGRQLTEQQIMDFVADQVAPYKKLRGGVRFLDEIPRAASGKILRRLLRERGD